MCLCAHEPSNIKHYLRTQSLSQFTFIWKEIMVFLLLISRDLDSYNLRWDFVLQFLCWCVSVAQSCPTLCDPNYCSIPGFPVLYHLPEFAQTHVHWVSDAIQPSHPLSFPSPPAFNLSQRHGKQMGKKWKQWQISLSWALKSLQTVTAAMKLKDSCSLEEKL